MSENKFEYLSAAAVARLSYEDRQAYYRNLIDADSEADDEMFEDDDGEIDVHIRQNLDSDMEVEEYEVEINDDADSDEDDSEEPLSASNNDGFFSSKDGTKWYKHPPRINRQPAHNIIRYTSLGPSPITKNLSKIDIFKLIFSEPIRDLICRYSNKKAKYVYAQWNEVNSEKPSRSWKPITDDELLAFVGILLFTGCHISSKEPVTELWKKNAFPPYRATMSRNRFTEILRFIRFDWHTSRLSRQETDKAEAIRDVFEMVNSNFGTYYRPHESISVDEQLFAYRGRTRFTQYMPSKPAKYGIKIWWACDSYSYYPLRGQLYTGKEGNVREKNQGERVLKDLVAPYKGSGRNITTGNFFTTLSLANELRSWKLSMVGTVKKNKTYIPNEFKPSRNREEHSSLFGFNETTTMCSYVPAKNKAVIMLSTMHADGAITGPKNKPDIIMFYNKTKGGVDTMDRMVSQYSTKKGTFRWPLAIFNILDVAALAAFIIYEENQSNRVNRTRFLEDLGEELCRPHILLRSTNRNITGRFHIKSAIECILGVTASEPHDDEQFEPNEAQERYATGRIKVKGKCYKCLVEKKRRNTRQICRKCKKPICVEHSISQTKCENCHADPSTNRSVRK